VELAENNSRVAHFYSQESTSASSFIIVYHFTMTSGQIYLNGDEHIPIYHGVTVLMIWFTRRHAVIDKIAMFHHYYNTLNLKFLSKK
jgi:hypothetical protein